MISAGYLERSEAAVGARRQVCDASSRAQAGMPGTRSGAATGPPCGCWSQRVWIPEEGEGCPLRLACLDVGLLVCASPGEREMEAHG